MKCSTESNMRLASTLVSVLEQHSTPVLSLHFELRVSFLVHSEYLSVYLLHTIYHYHCGKLWISNMQNTTLVAELETEQTGSAWRAYGPQFYRLPLQTDKGFLWQRVYSLSIHSNTTFRLIQPMSSDILYMFTYVLAMTQNRWLHWVLQTQDYENKVSLALRSKI